MTSTPLEGDDFLAALLARIPNGSVNVFDPDLRYIFAGGEGLAAAGLSPEMLVGRTVAELFTAESAALVEPFYRRALAGEAVRFDLPVFGRVYSISAGPFERDGDSITSIIAVSQDITDVKSIESALAASEARLRVADRRKDDFLAILAHELRQPVQAAHGALALLRTSTDAETAERARQVLERQVGQISRLVEDLLDAARIVRGEAPLKLRPLDIRESVTTAVDTVVATDGAKHIVQLDVPREKVLVSADPERIHQVFVNLVGNAVKYSPGDTRIEVRVTRTADLAAIEIVDEGVGIDSSELPSIFDLFARAAQDQPGLGVGLAVVRRIVEGHGGRVEASSAGRGAGARFTVTLPLLAV